MVRRSRWCRRLLRHGGRLVTTSTVWRTNRRSTPTATTSTCCRSRLAAPRGQRRCRARGRPGVRRRGRRCDQERVRLAGWLGQHVPQASRRDHCGHFSGRHARQALAQTLTSQGAYVVTPQPCRQLPWSTSPAAWSGRSASTPPVSHQRRDRHLTRGRGCLEDDGGARRVGGDPAGPIDLFNSAWRAGARTSSAP